MPELDWKALGAPSWFCCAGVVGFLSVWLRLHLQIIRTPRDALHRITCGAPRGLLKRIGMSNNVHWITARITEARKHHASVTEVVSARIEELLNGQLSERQLSSTELASVAEALIADTVPAPPKAKQ